MKRLFLFIPYLLLAMMMCFGGRAHAQSAQSTADVAAGGNKNWGVELSLTQNSSLKSKDDADYSSSSDLGLSPTIALGKVTASAEMALSKSWEDDQELTLQDIRLSAVAKALSLGAGFSFASPFFLTLPTSKESRQTKSLEASVAVAPTLSFDFSKIKVKGLKMSYGLTLTRNFHKYTTASDGVSNTQYGVANVLGLDLSFLKIMSLSIRASQRNSFTYEAYLKQSYRHTEELKAQVSDLYAVALGHTNEGSALKPNGQDTANILDRNKSEVYLSLSASF